MSRQKPSDFAADRPAGGHKKARKQPKRKGFFRRQVVDFALDRDVSEEIERQRAILESHPTNARAAFDLGVLLNSRRRREDAIAMYKRAIELDPGMVPAHRNLGEIYVVLDRMDLAWEEARRAAELGNRHLLDLLERLAPAPPPARSEKDKDS